MAFVSFVLFRGYFFPGADSASLFMETYNEWSEDKGPHLGAALTGVQMSGQKHSGFQQRCRIAQASLAPTAVRALRSRA